MTPKQKRRQIDTAITVATIAALWAAGAGWWALLAAPYGMWNFYDGMTRGKLAGH
jgi:hypothetical protein